MFYASLKCWPGLGSARPDSGLLIGDAVVLTDVARFTRPVLIGGRRFQYGCEIFFESLAPLGSGLPIGSVRNELDLTAGRANYGQALRRTPVLLSHSDTRFLRGRLRGVSKSFDATVDEYLETAPAGNA